MKAEILNNKQFIFIIGAPRSGTTLLFRSVWAHPEVSSAGRELNLFSSYIAPLVKSYEKETSNNIGLPLLIKREKFDDLMLQYIENVYSSFTILPQHKVIVDKSPAYSEHVDLIDYYIPGAKYIHIIRDGRDVAYSWNRMWTKGFGTPEFKSACFDWISCKNWARTAKKFKGRYYELRYEDFLHNTEEELGRLFAFCEINTAPEVIKLLVEQTTGESNMVSVPDNSVSYSERISGKSLWKIRLTKKQLYLAKKYLAKDLIIEGYEKDNTWGPGPFENTIYSVYFFTLARFTQVKNLLQKINKKITKNTA